MFLRSSKPFANLCSEIGAAPLVQANEGTARGVVAEATGAIGSGLVILKTNEARLPHCTAMRWKSSEKYEEGPELGQ
jgi:hypothetical protein